jgi:hypothetical protein
VVSILAGFDGYAKSTTYAHYVLKVLNFVYTNGLWGYYKYETHLSGDVMLAGASSCCQRVLYTAKHNISITVGEKEVMELLEGVIGDAVESKLAPLVQKQAR